MHDSYLRVCKRFNINGESAGLVFYYVYADNSGPRLETPLLQAVVSVWEDMLRPLDTLVRDENDYKVCEKYFPFGYSLILKGINNNHSLGFLAKILDFDTQTKRWMLIVPVNEEFNVVEDAVTAAGDNAYGCNIATQLLLSHSMKLLDEWAHGGVGNAVNELNKKYNSNLENLLNGSLIFWCNVTEIASQVWPRIKPLDDPSGVDVNMREFAIGADNLRSLSMHGVHPAAVRYALLEAEHFDVYYDYQLALQNINSRFQNFFDDAGGLEALLGNFISGYLGDFFSPILEILRSSRKFKGDIAGLTLQLEQKVRATERLFSRRRAEIKAEISQYFNFNFP